MRTGVAHLPLHHGKAPRWLFAKMVRLAREITRFVVEEFGPHEMLARLSDPYWFQAFGCVLAFDWHSSGVTTTVCGALKEGVRGLEEELGLFVCGGKGATSRKTPTELAAWGERLGFDPAPLVYASRMSAKVDNTAVQDGYQLYHHAFLFTSDGTWAVVQQGMSDETKYARRYHWLSTTVERFVCEPHSAICCDARGETLNFVAHQSEAARQTVTRLAQQAPQDTVAELQRVRELALPAHHLVPHDDEFQWSRLAKTLEKAREASPGDFEALLTVEGVGPKTLRALSLLSELVYGAPPSYTDPVRYSFAHGGKDGHPYPVDRVTYEQSIAVLHRALERAKVDHTDRVVAFRRLASWVSTSEEVGPA